MSFKENLKEKIRIDRLTRHVISSIGSVESGRRIDKPAMRTLLETAGYQSRTERGIEMYATDFSDGGEKIVVLDNELKIYDSTIDDVELRKNPTTKEMISFRNIRKILNDKDVVVSHGNDTVRKIRRQNLENLDLSYTPADIEDIYADGVSGLEHNDSETVDEALELFAELLNLLPPPTVRFPNLRILGRQKKEDGEVREYGPIYAYSRTENILRKHETVLTLTTMNKKDVYKELVYGETEPDLKDSEVFDDLREKVLALNENTVPIDLPAG